MFGRKKYKDPRTEAARGLIPKLQSGSVNNLDTALQTIPASHTIKAVLPGVGFTTEIWILTDKAIIVWNSLGGVVIPLTSSLVVAKNIMSLEIGAPGMALQKLRGHHDNMNFFYSQVMSSL